MVKAFAAVLLLASCASAETLNFGDRRLSVLIEKPAGNGPFPLLVIAPAKEYTMTGRLFQRLSEGAVRLGYATVRFDWGFTAEKGKPSPGLWEEAADLAAVTDHFTKQPFVDPARVVLEAKSLGSRVAMLGGHKAASALLLWTPNCNSETPFETAYAPILGGTKPVHIAISAQDPYCDLPQISAALPKLGPAATLQTLTGDHNFLLKDGPPSLSEDAAIAGSLAWLERHKETRK